MSRSGYMPQNYEWRCKVCEVANLAGRNACAKCGHDAHLSPKDVDAARTKLSMPPPADDAVEDIKQIFGVFTKTQIIVTVIAVVAVLAGALVIRLAGADGKIPGLALIIIGLSALVSLPPDRRKK